MFATAGVVIAYQFHSINTLRRELRSNSATTSTVTNVVHSSRPQFQPAAASGSGNDLVGRIQNLENAVAQLANAAEHLMDRGMVPPDAQKLQQLQNTFADPNADPRNRFQAFRLLRRNNAITDEVAMHAVTWLQTATNSNIKRELLQGIDGLRNPVLQQPLFAMLQTETDAGTRQRLVDALSDFANDPGIERKMWELAASDPDEDVRQEAQQALIGGDKTPEKLAALMQKARDTSQPIETRLLALRGLRESETPMSDVVADFAALAQNSQDPALRRQIFDAFDSIRDPAMMVPLVYGLQDQDAAVRARAADALSNYSSEPQVQDWLRHIAQNDSDPRVRREANQALEEAQRRNRRGEGRRN